MRKTIGFIGCGNMAQAMIESIIKSKTILPEDIIASPYKEEIKEKFGISITKDNKEVASKSDYIILAVKPNIYKEVIDEIKDYVKEDGIIISIAAGISSKFLKDNLNKDTKFIKTMPNTPVMVGEGMIGISLNDSINERDLDSILSIFNSFGKVEIIDENLMDGFTGLCGSSPAYIFILIEAMADGGVLEGIPRDQAYTMAAQSVLGAAKMVLETETHPGKLKDNVSSPGGTTIEAIASLEENNFRSSVIQAIRVCSKKSREMTK